MRKNQFEPMEPNTGTYQTGVTHQPEKSASGLIAVLLVLTIFLGGLASILGIVNIRLVQKLMQTPDPTLPLSIQTPSTPAPLDPHIPISNDQPEPVLPETCSLRLALQAQPNTQKDLVLGDVFTQNARSLVQVQAEEGFAEGSGTGVILSADGYILTNASRVFDAGRIFVRLYDGSIHRAALVGLDSLTDLAVIYIDAMNLQPAAFACAELLGADEPLVITIDSISLGQEALKSGKVLQPRKTMGLGQHRVPLIQTSIGSSDGPVFNRYGQIVGMNSFLAPKYFDLYIQANTGYALPGETIVDVVNQILEKGTVTRRPTLGLRLEPITKLYQQYWDLPGGLRITDVSENAAQQDIRVGDILLALDGRRLESNMELYRLLLETPIGTTLTAVVFRDGQSITMPLTVLDTGE